MKGSATTPASPPLDFSLRLPDGGHAGERRCSSVPPWSSREIGSRLDLRIGRAAKCFYVDSNLLGKYRSIRTINVSANHCVVLLDEVHILKMMNLAIDVESVVILMRIAEKVVPVPRVLDYGRSGNCGYILMECIRGYKLSELVAFHGPLAAARMETQIDVVVSRLSRVGICHNGLYPRNVIVDDRWNIVSIFAWDQAEFRCFDGYQRRLYTWFYHSSAAHPVKGIMDIPFWNHNFLKHSHVPFGSMDLDIPSVRRAAIERRLPCTLLAGRRIPSLDIPTQLDLRRSVIQVSRSHSAEPVRIAFVSSSQGAKLFEILVDLASTMQLQRAHVALVILDSKLPRSKAGIIPSYLNVVTVNPFDFQRQPGPRLSHSEAFDYEIAWKLADARPDIVFLLDWPYALGRFFWQAVHLPRRLSSPGSPCKVIRLICTRDGNPRTCPNNIPRVRPSTCNKYGFQFFEVRPNSEENVVIGQKFTKRRAGESVEDFYTRMGARAKVAISRVLLSCLSSVMIETHVGNKLP